MLGYGMIGGRYAVGMEKIVQRRESYGPDHLQTWSQNLKSLVKGFHDDGWVHGDLRDANLVVNHKPEHIMLIDFDWGGKADDGPVYYSTALMNKELEKPGNLSNVRASMKSILALTLDKLEKQIRRALKGGPSTDPNLLVYCSSSYSFASSFVNLPPTESPWPTINDVYHEPI
jgi:serine/threonine protein kinase